MDFILNEEDAMIQKMVRDIAKTDILPHAADVDLNERYPSEALEALWDQGLMNLRIPENYDGGGGSSISFLLSVEEIAKVCPSTAEIFTSQALVTYALLNYGTEEQKEKYLKKMAKGAYAALAVTELDSGSDVGSVATSAVNIGDHYTISGTKSFITNGEKAEIFLVIAMTDRSKGHKGLTAFIVEKDLTVEIIKKDEKLGLRGAPLNRITFNDTEVPYSNRLGEAGEGYKVSMKIADHGRAALSALCVGLSQGAFDAALRYSKERFQFGKAISNFQAIQLMLAEMVAKIHQARLIVYHMGWLIDNGARNFTREAAIAKLNSSETATEVTNKAMQILGGHGCIKESPVERFYRDAKMMEVLGSSNQILKIIISKALF